MMATVRTFNPNPHDLLEIRRAFQMLRIQLPPSTYDQITAPTSADDITKGWRIGSKWIDENKDNIYECADNTEGAAVWNMMVDQTFGDGAVAVPAKGTLLVYNAALGKWAPLAVGANDEGLVADSAQTLGLKYVTLASTVYAPAVPDDWAGPDPTTPGGALDRIAGGHAGVCLISDTKPTTPGEGQLRLDTSMAGSSGLGTLNFVTITADLVLTSSHTLVYADASAGPIIVTVPAAVGNGRKLYAIVKTDATANTVTMDGGFDAVLTCQDEAVPIHSDGTNWRIPF